MPAQAAGRPGRSALAQYRRRRGQELAAWTGSLVWRAPLGAAAGLTGSALTTQAGLARTPATVAGLAAAALVGWRLRFRPSTQARAWQRGARGERQTARQLDRLGRDGYQVFHDLVIPGSLANIDHLVVGPSGVFVIDSKQWTGSVHQSAAGLIWHNHYRLDRALATICWQALTLGRLLGIPVAPLVCVHGAHVQGGGLRAQGVAIVPATLLPRRSASAACSRTRRWRCTRPPPRRGYGRRPEPGRGFSWAREVNGQEISCPSLQRGPPAAWDWGPHSRPSWPWSGRQAAFAAYQLG